jgi:enhancer of mRNA-decapping protein 4
VKIVSETCGVGPWRGGEVEDGYLEIEAHSKLIVDAAFSPDGSAIATASLDGHCKFYQVHTNPTPFPSPVLFIFYFNFKDI